MQRNISLIISAFLFGVVPAWGGFYEDLYRGLGYFATPSGSPISAVSGGGLQNGSRFGRLRIVPNDFGNGYRLELDRTFGSDSRGRTETFDIGPMELSLNGAMQSTVQYTDRLLPTLNVDIFSNSLQFVLEDKFGVQDFELTGSLTINHQLEINRLGFYDLTLDIAQTDSELTADGVIVDGVTDMDYNVGPIQIKGNIFVDMAAAAINGLGLDASGLEQVFPASPIARINDEINNYLGRQQAVLSELLTADLADGTLSDEGAGAARDFVDGLVNLVDDSANSGAPLNVPESSSLVLIGALTLAALRRRF